MALINCPECGKEISDAAASCPHCGYPIKGPLPKSAFYSKEEIERFEIELKQCQRGAKVFGISGFISLIAMICMLVTNAFGYSLICNVLAGVFAFISFFALFILLPVNSTMANNRAKIINEYNKYRKDSN